MLLLVYINDINIYCASITYQTMQRALHTLFQLTLKHI